MLLEAIVYFCFSDFCRQQLHTEMKNSMKNAYAEGSFKNLHTQWETFFMFCGYFKLDPFPVSVDTLCLYAQFLNRSFASVQSIKNYISGIKVLHTMLDLEFPTKNILQLNVLLRGISRSKQHIIKKAEIITPKILIDIYKVLKFDCSFDIVIWSLFLMMFFLMTRKSNMVPMSVKKFDSNKQLTRGDIIVQDDLLLVNFKWSKTRQFGHSRQIPVSAIPGSCLCPVEAYKNVLKNVSCTSDESAFCYNVSKTTYKVITYPQFQKKLRELITLTGRNGQLFSSHSFRRGSCTWAFKSNIESELIKYHGDWLSHVYTEYLSYDFEQKLSVSQRMSSRILHEL